MTDRPDQKDSSSNGSQPSQLLPHPLDSRRSDGPDCVSQDYPDPLVSEELERKRAGLDPEPEPDWTEKAKTEIVSGLEQIRDALHDAYRDGKNDPKIKKFGEDVKESFRTIGDEISKLFD